jgi:hypothetical protein
VLARHIRYEGGDNQFEVLFVETIPRQFLGRRITSVLLSSIVIASRLRFAYFENREEIVAAFDARVPSLDFQARCRQLLYDIERLQHESVEFGVDETNFIAAFGDDNKATAEQFVNNWGEATKQLYQVLPPNFERITEEERPKVETAVRLFLKTCGSGE